MEHVDRHSVCVHRNEDWRKAPTKLTRYHVTSRPIRTVNNYRNYGLICISQRASQQWFETDRVLAVKQTSYDSMKAPHDTTVTPSPNPSATTGWLVSPRPEYEGRYRDIRMPLNHGSDITNTQYTVLSNDTSDRERCYEHTYMLMYAFVRGKQWVLWG